MAFELTATVATGDTNRDVLQPNCLFEAESRSFSVAERWKKCRALCASALPLDAFKQLSPQKR